MDDLWIEDQMRWAKNEHRAELQPIDGGFHVKPAAVEGMCIDIMWMPSYWRIARSDEGHCWGYDRGWCYAGRGKDTFLRALGEALAWDGGDLTRPEGWIKELITPHRSTVILGHLLLEE